MADLSPEFHELMTDALDGRLTPDRRARFQGLLDSSDACRREWDAARDLRGILLGLATEKAPPTLLEGVRRGMVQQPIPAEPAVPFHRWSHLGQLGWVRSALVAAMFLIVAVIVTQDPPGPELSGWQDDNRSSKAEELGGMTRYGQTGGYIVGEASRESKSGFELGNAVVGGGSELDADKIPRDRVKAVAKKSPSAGASLHRVSHEDPLVGRYWSHVQTAPVYWARFASDEDEMAKALSAASPAIDPGLIDAGIRSLTTTLEMASVETPARGLYSLAFDLDMAGERKQRQALPAYEAQAPGALATSAAGQSPGAPKIGGREQKAERNPEPRFGPPGAEGPNKEGGAEPPPTPPAAPRTIRTPNQPGAAPNAPGAGASKSHGSGAPGKKSRPSALRSETGQRLSTPVVYTVSGVQATARVRSLVNSGTPNEAFSGSSSPQLQIRERTIAAALRLSTDRRDQEARRDAGSAEGRSAQASPGYAIFEVTLSGPAADTLVGDLESQAGLSVRVAGPTLMNFDAERTDKKALGGQVTPLEQVREHPHEVPLRTLILVVLDA